MQRVPVQKVHGVIQRYAWGDLTSIAHLLGDEPDGQPAAELWFGTHPAAPSQLDDGQLLESFTGPLPYLLKVLAAAEPLSLQVHPTSQQAIDGFTRENAAGIPLDAPQRTYRDTRHKPELLLAMSPFEVVCGFAPLDSTDSLLAELGQPAASLRTVFSFGGVDAVLALLLNDRPTLGPLIDAAAHHDDPRCRWLNKLSQLYPGDPSAAILLLLNYVAMEPGEAIYLEAGNMHAYLGGTGIEVMASSDNVLRCGLTNKYVDVAEVLSIVQTVPLRHPIVQPVRQADGGLAYPVPVDDFRICRHDIDGSVGWRAVGPELLLCLEGETLQMAQGECLAVTDGHEIELVGTATILRVGAGLGR